MDRGQNPGHMRRWLLLLALGIGVPLGCTPLKTASDEPAVEKEVFAYPEVPPPWVYSGVTQRDNDELQFTGVSQRHSTEQQARMDAVRDAREQIAAFLVTDVSKQIQRVTVSTGPSSQVLDPIAVQQKIAKLLSVTPLLGTASTQFYIQKWLRKESGESTTSWKAYALVSFPEEQNREIRAALLEGAAQRCLDRLHQVETARKNHPGAGAFPRDFEDRIRALRNSMAEGHHLETIVQAQDLLDRVASSDATARVARDRKPRTPDAVDASARPVEPPVLYPRAKPAGKLIDLQMLAENRAFDPRRRAPFHLILDLKAPAMPVEGRNPVKLGLVLDVSGSMKEEGKLEALREAASQLMRQLSADDQIAVVTFNHQARVLFPLTRARNRTLLRASLENLSAGGRTNLSAGLLEGWSQLELSGSSPHLKRLLVVTDGLANEGLTERDKFLALVRRNRAHDITVSTAGVGQDFDEKLLIGIADVGGGTYYYLPDPDQTTRVLQGELGALRGVVAQNLRVVLQPSQGWRIAEVSNFEAAFAPDGKATFEVGDMAVGDVTRILFKAEYSGSRPAEEAVFGARVTYDDVAFRLSRQTRKSSVRITPTYSNTVLQSGVNRPVLVQAHLAKGLDTVECAIMCLEHHDPTEARQLLVKARDEAARVARRLDSEELAHQRDVIDQFLKKSVPRRPGERRLDQIPRLRKLLASYWYAAARNKVCPHCGVRHLSGDAGGHHKRAHARK